MSYNDLNNQLTELKEGVKIANKKVKEQTLIISNYLKQRLDELVSQGVLIKEVKYGDTFYKSKTHEFVVVNGVIMSLDNRWLGDSIWVQTHKDEPWAMTSGCAISQSIKAAKQEGNKELLEFLLKIKDYCMN